MEFDVRPADVDEAPIDGESPVDYVERIAHDKAAAVAASLGNSLPDVVVLAADTTVALDAEILTKPTDDDDARRMLRLLSGGNHQVHTAVVGLVSDEVHEATVTTEVTFARLSEQGISWYLSMGEHGDKAGAYAMQGAGGALVHRIAGSPSNVIGLPLAETIGVLRACGVAVVGG